MYVYMEVSDGDERKFTVVMPFDCVLLPEIYCVFRPYAELCQKCPHGIGFDPVTKTK